MKKILLLLFTFSSITAFSQDASVSDKSILSVNIVLPGLEYESALSKETTLNLNLGFGFAYRSGVFGEGYGVFPAFIGQYRWFYNLEKRLEKEKSIDNNSGNYLALYAVAQSGEPLIGDLSYRAKIFGTVGPAWGLQRYYGSGFKLNLNLGYGYGFNDLGDSGFSPIIGIRLGWLLSN